jgi:hypothetical protein
MMERFGVAGRRTGIVSLFSAWVIEVHATLPNSQCKTKGFQLQLLETAKVAA